MLNLYNTTTLWRISNNTLRIPEQIPMRFLEKSLIKGFLNLSEKNNIKKWSRNWNNLHKKGEFLDKI